MSKPEPLDKELYNRIKDKVWKMYEKERRRTTAT